MSDGKGRERQAGTRATRGKKFTTATNGKKKKNRQGVRERAVDRLVVENKNCGKWKGESHLELPSKHQRVSKDEGDLIYSMMEAGNQPCQSQ